MSRLDTITYLRKVLEELEEERDVLDKQIDSIRSTVNIVESRPESEQASSKQAQALRDSIYEILSEEHPLHRRTIHDRLILRGVKVGGQDPVNTVGAHLSRDARFRNVGRGEWDLDERYFGRINNEGDQPNVEEDVEIATLAGTRETMWDSPYEKPYKEPAGYYGDASEPSDADDLPW